MNLLARNETWLHDIGGVPHGVIQAKSMSKLVHRKRLNIVRVLRSIAPIVTAGIVQENDHLLIRPSVPVVAIRQDRTKSVQAPKSYPMHQEAAIPDMHAVPSCQTQETSWTDWPATQQGVAENDRP